MNAKLEAAPVVMAGPVKFGNNLPVSIIAGPCQLESRSHALEVASALKEIAARLKIGLVYKTSFDKANRSSGSAARGIGLLPTAEGYGSRGKDDARSANDEATRNHHTFCHAVHCRQNAYSSESRAAWQFVS